MQGIDKSCKSAGLSLPSFFIHFLIVTYHATINQHPFPVGTSVYDQDHIDLIFINVFARADEYTKHSSSSLISAYNLRYFPPECLADWLKTTEKESKLLSSLVESNWLQWERLFFFSLRILSSRQWSRADTLNMQRGRRYRAGTHSKILRKYFLHRGINFLPGTKIIRPNIIIFAINA